MIKWQIDPSDEPKNLHDAMKYLKSLGDGWRLPTKTEIVNAYDNGIMEYTSLRYWSSSKYFELLYNAYNYYFRTGTVTDIDESYYFFVVCVKNIKGE